MRSTNLDSSNPDFPPKSSQFGTPRPTDNAFIESFNGRFRQECLNENWFLSLEDAEEKVESWRNHYNGERMASDPTVPWEICPQGSSPCWRK